MKPFKFLIFVNFVVVLMNCSSNNYKNKSEELNNEKPIFDTQIINYKLVNTASEIDNKEITDTLNSLELNLLFIVEHHLNNDKYNRFSNFNSGNWIIVISIAENGVKNCMNVKLSDQLKNNPNHFLNLKCQQNRFFKYKDFICIVLSKEETKEKFPNLFMFENYRFHINPNLTIRELNNDLLFFSPYSCYYLYKDFYTYLGNGSSYQSYYTIYDSDSPEF